MVKCQPRSRNAGDCSSKKATRGLSRLLHRTTTTAQGRPNVVYNTPTYVESFSRNLSRGKLDSNESSLRPSLKCETRLRVGRLFCPRDSNAGTWKLSFADGVTAVVIRLLLVLSFGHWNGRWTISLNVFIAPRSTWNPLTRA